MSPFIAFIFIIVINLWIMAANSAASQSNLYWDKSSIKPLKRYPYYARKAKRKKALNWAKPFLKPYKDLMGEHCLANENCKVTLIIEKDGSKKIICINKHLTNGKKRKILTAIINSDIISYYSQPEDYVMDDIWDILCLNFTYSTMYENILDAAKSALLKITESYITVGESGNSLQKIYDGVSNTQIRTNNLLNINNATEAELSALPGVNVVIAKKIVKYVEKNGGFKTVDEFISKMKIKNVFAKKIKQSVCVLPVENNTSEINNKVPENFSESEYLPHSQNERIIDL